jgi:hypothetical protein
VVFEVLLFKLEVAQSHFGCALRGCDRAEVKTTHACGSLRLHRPMYSDSPILMPPATAPVIPASSTCVGTTSLRSATWNKSNRSRRKRAPHCGHLCCFDSTATDTKQQEKHGHKAVVKAENHVTKVQPILTADVGGISRCIKKPKVMQQWRRIEPVLPVRNKTLGYFCNITFGLHTYIVAFAGLRRDIAGFVDAERNIAGGNDCGCCGNVVLRA